MVMQQRALPGLVCIFDRTAGALSGAWWLGDLINRTKHHRGVRSWWGLIAYLRELREAGVSVREIQLWSHGTIEGPMIAGRPPSPRQLREIREAAPDLVLFWFRACDVGRMPQNVVRLATLLDCRIAAHCVIVATGEADLDGWWSWLPFRKRFAPWHQGRVIALDPGDVPTYDPDDDSLLGCKTTDMVLPAHAHAQAIA